MPPAKKSSTQNTDSSNEPTVKKTTTKKPKKETIDLSKFGNIVDIVYDAKSLNDIKNELADHLLNLYSKSGLTNHEVLYLYQPYESIDEDVADKIYNSLPAQKVDKLLLIINSPGGRIEPAYLISKVCKEISDIFVVSIPRKAKSAATLISLGAEEIHMGNMSELGPIDPQFGGLPALGLSSALERLAQLSKKYPESSDMFANYLAKKLDLGVLGYFERVSESAVHYAERLLKNKKLPNKETPDTIANRFVYSYKDHSFVIDKDEAELSLGSHIKVNTPEYMFGNKVHNFLESLNFCTKIFKKQNVSLIGTNTGFKYFDVK
jgi:ClpP class serine protease